MLEKALRTVAVILGLVLTTKLCPFGLAPLVFLPSLFSLLVPKREAKTTNIGKAWRTCAAILDLVITAKLHLPAPMQIAFFTSL